MQKIVIDYDKFEKIIKEFNKSINEIILEGKGLMSDISLNASDEKAITSNHKKLDLFTQEIIIEKNWMGGFIRCRNYAVIMNVFNAINESGMRFKNLGITEDKDPDGRPYYELWWE